jgi:hypothetical protein
MALAQWLGELPSGCSIIGTHQHAGNGRCVAFAKRVKLAEIVGDGKPGVNDVGDRLLSSQRGFYLLLSVCGQRRVRDLTDFVRKLT